MIYCWSIHLDHTEHNRGKDSGVSLEVLMPCFFAVTLSHLWVQAYNSEANFSEPPSLQKVDFRWSIASVNEREREKVSWCYFCLLLTSLLRIIIWHGGFFIVHFSPPRGVLSGCTVKSQFGLLFNDFFFSLPKLCLWDSSQHAKTREVLQQAELVKRCLAGCTVPHTSNYSLLLFCQPQWLSCSLYCTLYKLWNCTDLLLWSFFFPR